ncbi:MAG: proton-conducting transporter membrane subunit [Candidatus Sumerlaeia bacterium]
MSFVIASILIMLAAAVAALPIRRSAAVSYVGAGGAAVGAAVGLVGACRVLFSGASESIRLAWPVPGGAFYCEVDGLSAFFLLPILGIAGLAAVYGVGYLRGRGSLGRAWFFYNVLAASMALVVIARNGLLFLVAWEVMSAASFFLVVMDDRHERVRRAGWTYLVATHIGTAFLFLMFVMLGQATGSMDFDRFSVPAGSAGVLFVFALIGFGTKAGLVPLHVWLPEAHPAAPSHVSAVMSGVMIKTGIYGIVRMLTLLGAPAPWWGWLLIALGMISGILGILFALTQRDLKKLLAYCSVENIGVITLGLGLGVLGRATGSPTIAALGFAGALLHTINHAVFKGLLFLGAGSVQHAAHTLDIERLGGLLKRMPLTGLTFMIAAAAICGLPPLNGFASEFLVYMASLNAVSGAQAGVAVGAIAALALIGGLAVACFTKAFGIVFLGEPRTADGDAARDPDGSMRVPMVVLAALCVFIGAGAPWIVGSMGPVLAQLCGNTTGVDAALVQACVPMAWVVIGGALLVMAGLVLALFRKSLLRGRQIGEAGTWDCGYARPTGRMQYSASSFAQPITDFFESTLRTKKHVERPEGLFPGKASLETHTPDTFAEGLWRPIFCGLGRLLARLHWLQAGSIHLYILYIAITLVVLLIWKLG